MIISYKNKTNKLYAVCIRRIKNPPSFPVCFPIDLQLVWDQIFAMRLNSLL